jgi:hypothetical protein
MMKSKSLFEYWSGAFTISSNMISYISLTSIYLEIILKQEMSQFELKKTKIYFTLI